MTLNRGAGRGLLTVDERERRAGAVVDLVVADVFDEHAVPQLVLPNRFVALA